VTVTGDRNLTVQGSNLGNLTLNGTTAAVLRASSRQVVAGTGTLAEDVQRGSEAFAASSTEAVVFGVAHPDADYTVCLEYEVNALAVTKNKLATGFTIEFPSGPQTTSVNYAVLR
jgi:TPP-dependent trihydroxycyclohexane-1,2-dione (THcHDO) dehydratase